MIEVHNATVGFGELGRRGRLGYHCPEAGDRLIVPDYYDDALSAHAPSTIDVTFTEPVSVRAVANPTCFAPAVPCHIDMHQIGTLTDNVRRTPEVHLVPGRYSLRMEVDGPPHGAHTAWLIRRDTRRQKRVAIVAYTFYSADAVPQLCRFLFASAAKQGLHVRCIGVNERMRSLTHGKIILAYEHLKAIPDTYDYIVVLDALDTILLGDEEEIVSKITDGVLLGCEICSWPLGQPDWDKHFSDGEDETAHRFPNSGVIAGSRASLVSAFHAVVQLYHDIGNRRCEGVIAKYRHYRDDDQFMWQAAWIINKGLYTRDMTCRLSTSIGCGRGHLSGNPDVEIEGRRVRSPYGTYPTILHCSGPASSLLELWYRALVL